MVRHFKGCNFCLSYFVYMYIIIINEWKLVLNSWSIVLHVTFKQESYFVNKTISSTKLPSPTQSFKKGYEEVCLKLLSKVKHFIFVFTIKMWQNDKICFLKIFTWHPKKDQNFNCAFEDDKWRVFPNTFNPFISSDWQIEFCELHSFWIVVSRKLPC